MKAYTLIELLVTVAIVVLLTGGSLAAYLNFDSGQRMTSEARDFLGLVDRVRQKAISLEYADTCTGLVNFTVRSATDLQTVEYFPVCEAGTISQVSEKILRNSRFSAAFTMEFLAITGKLASGEDEIIDLVNINQNTLTRRVQIDSELSNKSAIVE